jgi:hypothetical protein
MLTLSASHSVADGQHCAAGVQNGRGVGVLVLAVRARKAKLYEMLNNDFTIVPAAWLVQGNQRSVG